MLELVAVGLLIGLVNFALLEYFNNKEKYSFLMLFNAIAILFSYTFLKTPFIKSIVQVVSSFTIALLLFIILNINTSSSKENLSKKKYTGDPIILYTTDKKQVKYFNPLNNFLIYGGQNAGKTSSIGKPVLLDYLRLGYSTFTYDAKEFDYAKTLYGYYTKERPNANYYYANFNDPNRSHRFNPIKPKLFSRITQFTEVNIQFLKSINGVKGKDDIWFKAASGLYNGISYIFYKYFPEMCTIPHITNFFLQRDTEDIMKFLEMDDIAKGYASSIFKGKDSKNTIGSVMFSLSGFLGPLASDPIISYILSGDDFDFNFVDPEKPLSFSLSSSSQVSATLSPIMGALVNISAKQFTKDNTNKFLYCLDEATTFEIPGFEGLPSLLRESNVAFMMLTQSASKIEKVYGKLDLNSIHSNFDIKMFGKTGDTNASRMYQQLFEKVYNKYVSESKNTGSHSSSEGETTSYKKEFKYETDFFTKLEPGEFVGVGGTSNYIDFHKRFKMYDKRYDMEPKITTPTILTNKILEEHHYNLINEVKSLTI